MVQSILPASAVTAGNVWGSPTEESTNVRKFPRIGATMKWLGRTWSAIALIIPMGLASALAAEAPADLGILQPFYRSTQLQGHLIGLHLIEIPEYLLGSDIDFPYRRKPGAAREIPFVDSFTINRFLGGYREDWLRQPEASWDNNLGIRSMDYVVRSADGSLRFRPELIERRLKPYLAVGYRPQDITLALENVPSDLARAPEFGNWGDRSPPADLRIWTEVISHFASDLKAYLGSAASAVSFKTGVEYDEKASFDGSSEDFFALYEATDRGLHTVLPGAALGPGEFTGLGECRVATCNYSTADFLRYASAHRLTVSDVPRSLHAFLNRPNPWPSAAVERAVDSYARLPAGTIAEIHQFGLMDQPFGLGAGAADPAAAQASWQFQTLMGLWQKLHPRRVFHWGGVIQMGNMEFLNGAGFLRLILDHYTGAHVFLLHPENGSGGRQTGGTESLAATFTGIGKAALIVSSFSPEMSAAKHVARFTLPSGLSSSSIRAIHYRASDNVFVRIRADLTNGGNLRREFSGCPMCLAPPAFMAVDLERARAIIASNYPAYQAKMKETLRWRSGDEDVSLQGRTLSANLEANELLVVELD